MTSGKMKPARVVIISVFWALVMAALAGCSFQDEEKIWEISGGIFGTTYHINVVLPEDEARLQTLAQGIEQTLNEVDVASLTGRKTSSRPDSTARKTKASGQSCRRHCLR